MPRKPPTARRLNFDEAPLRKLPIILMDSDGDIRVIRGDFDTTTLSPSNLDQLEWERDTAFLVFTNRLGQHWLCRRGVLIRYDEELTKVGQLDFDESFGAETLEDLVTWHREQAAEKEREARRHADRARQLEEAAADGWVLEQDPHNAAIGLRDTRPGPSFAPRRTQQ